MITNTKEGRHTLRLSMCTCIMLRASIMQPRVADSIVSSRVKSPLLSSPLEGTAACGA